MAILLKEEGLLERSIIYATDINPRSLEQARQGIFAMDHLRQYTANLLRVAFPHVQPQYIDQFVSGLCALSSDLVQYKVHLRDFLITSREITGGSDNSDLFLEEREAEQQRKAAMERENAAILNAALLPVAVFVTAPAHAQDVTAVTGPVFIWRTLTYYNPIVELRAFKNRNFLVGVVMTLTVGLALFGGPDARSWRDHVLNTARTFVFDTALAPVLAASAAAACRSRSTRCRT